jgi:predicted transposase YdaD
MSNDHDSSYKFLFSKPELVRDLIVGFIPDDWLHSLDYTTLKKVPGGYVSEDFRHRADDIVWRVKVGSDWVYRRVDALRADSSTNYDTLKRVDKD